MQGSPSQFLPDCLLGCLLLSSTRYFLLSCPLARDVVTGNRLSYYSMESIDFEGCKKYLDLEFLLCALAVGHLELGTYQGFIKLQLS